MFVKKTGKTLCKELKMAEEPAHACYVSGVTVVVGAKRMWEKNVNSVLQKVTKHTAICKIAKHFSTLRAFNGVDPVSASSFAGFSLTTCFWDEFSCDQYFFLRRFVPSYLRLGSWNIVMFVSYEQYKILSSRLQAIYDAPTASKHTYASTLK